MVYVMFAPIKHTSTFPQMHTTNKSTTTNGNALYVSKMLTKKCELCFEAPLNKLPTLFATSEKQKIKIKYQKHTHMSETEIFHITMDVFNTNSTMKRNNPYSREANKTIPSSTYKNKQHSQAYIINACWTTLCIISFGRGPLCTSHLFMPEFSCTRKRSLYDNNTVFNNNNDEKCKDF